MTDQLNLIDTIARAERFSTFTNLLRAVKADQWAQGNTEFTIFAPTNDAFGKLPATSLNELLTPEKSADLKALVSYHIMPGKHMATNLASAGSARSVTGQELRFGESNGLKV
ncbi:MAG TPA: fasciclin domain-containing protein, partial [Pyrinomonadaceae bacterium]|nr:fasciclin domain-containing protein [Pyrinomonadaceae bacterium]